MSARINVASGFLVSGDVTPASERLLTDAIEPARASSELTALLRGLTTLAALQRRQGRLREAAATYREAAQLAPEPDGLATLVHGAAYHFGLGDLLRELNDLDSAEQHLLQGRAMVRQGVLTDALGITLGYVGLARLQQARGDSKSAGATLHELAHLAQQGSFAAELMRRVVAAQAHLALIQGDLPAAAQWADSSGLFPDNDLSYPRELEYLTLARVRIAQGRGNLANAHFSDILRLLDQLLQASETGGRMESAIEIVLLRALVLHAQGDLDRARADLERALTAAAPEGFVRIFVDEGVPMAAVLGQVLMDREWGAENGHQSRDLRAYAQKLLDIFVAGGTDPCLVPQIPIPERRSTTPDLEPLTPREIEVLRLIAAGQSNGEIAASIVVAVSTVKSHIHSIFGKLGVTSRTQALVRARELGLL